MDYGALPPEINSARMYAGPGSGPMLAAASAWDGLAAELGSAASSYSSAVSGLAEGSWHGPASASMAAAAAPYVAWMSTTAGQAEQTANQARAAAAAYEAAFAMTVPPPVIAANRSLLMALVATNVLGQNTPAIAATEAHYGEMWAQDAAAMYGYAGSSAAASKVTPFTAPAQTTNPGGLASQSAAVAQTAGTSAGAGVQSTLSRITSTVPGALQALASPASAASSSSGFSGLFGPNGFFNSTFFNGVLSGNWMNPSSIMPAVTNALGDIGFLTLLEGGPAGLSPNLLTGAVPAAAGAALPSLAGSGLGGAAISAGMGQSTLVGSLSVPQSWAAAAPATSAPATASLVSSWAASPSAAAAETSGMPGMPGMPMVGSGGRGFGFAAPRYGFKPTVVAHPPAAG